LTSIAAACRPIELPLYDDTDRDGWLNRRELTALPNEERGIWPGRGGGQKSLAKAKWNGIWGGSELISKELKCSIEVDVLVV
jgi:hypothetical protein